jgi:creatinine amidohydrolase
MIEKIRTAELTSEEARLHLNGDAVLLLPMGSLEDQGTHSPMGDYLAADAVAVDIAKAARQQGVPTFVAPVIPFGGKDFFESSLGGVSLRHTTIVALLDDIFGCFVRHGLKKILIINGHGGNVAPITEVTLKWRQSHDTFIASMYLWQISSVLLQSMHGAERAAASSGHGADPLTSVVMHYFPEFVRSDLMRRPTKGLKVRGADAGGSGGTVLYQGVHFQAPTEASEHAPDGVWVGDPHLCSPGTGAALVEQLARLGAGFIKDHVARGFSED